MGRPHSAFAASRVGVATCALLLGWAVTGCGEAASDGGQPGVAGDQALRPGDGLLDHLHRARLAAWSGTSVPVRVRALVGPRTRVRSRPVPWAEWEREGLSAAEAERRRDRSGVDDDPLAGVFKWTALPRLFARVPPRTDEQGGVVPPRVLQGGQPAPEWNWRRQEPFPGEAIQWNTFYEQLQALGPTPPTGVAVEYEGDVRAVLGAYAPGEPREPGRPPPPEALRRRYEVQGESRAALALTAPARLVFELPGVAAQGLALALAARPGAFALRDEVLLETDAPGDGVTVAVEVEQGGERTRVFSRHVEPGEPWAEVEVSLSSTGGAPFRLHLVAGPGPAGDRAWDLALVAGLRLTGNPERVPERPHVIVIDVDTLRADRLGANGARRPTTPRIDAWAAEQAVVHRDVTSTASWTLPATASMLTGLAVHQHGVDDGDRSLQPVHGSLAARLGAVGYETRAVTEGAWVGPEFGFDHGFETFRTVQTHSTDWEESLEWLAARRSERPLFLFHHTYAVHSPYPPDDRFEDPEAPYTGHLAGRPIDGVEVIHAYRLGKLELDAADRRHVEACYDAGVAAMDEQVGAFLEALDEVLEGPLMVVLTSDHGEGFFEHGILGHSQGLYDEILRVPLVMRLPDGRPDVVDEPASLLDLVPTVLEVAGLPPDPTLPGRSLVRAGGAPAAVVSQHRDQAQALRAGPLKYVRGRAHPGQEAGVTEQLFDLARDPGEEADLSTSRPGDADRMERMLDDWLEHWAPVEGAGEAGDVALDPDVKARLEALGYVGEDG